MTLAFLSRSDWRADPLVCTAGYGVPREQFVGLALHHTVTGYVPSSSPDDVADHARKIQTARPDISRGADGRPEAPYSYGIAEHPDDPDAAWVVELRGAGRTGAHTAGYNSTRYGLALFGDYSTRPMTPGMVRAIRALAAVLLAHTMSPEPTIAHRQVYATACPGDAAMAQLDQLQPPFHIPDPMEGQSMTITEADRDALGLTYVPSRDYSKGDGSFTETPPAPVAQHAANAHIEAQRARLAAEEAMRFAASSAANLLAVRDELRSIAIVAARPPAPSAPLSEMTAELLADALLIALRRLLAAYPS